MRLPLGHGVDDEGRLLGRVGPHLGLVGELADAQRHDADRGQRGVPVQDAGQGVLERRGVVDARADDDLAVHLDAPVEQDAEPAQAGRPLGVAQHVGPQLGVGAVDGDEEGPEALGEDALGIELGEPGQGGEVPVEEREPVVVVLEVEAAPHALGQLVDEAEGAVVVAGADAVEHGRGHLDPERLARAPCRCGPGAGRAAPARLTMTLRSSASVSCWKSMTSRGSCPLRESSSSPTAKPARAAGDASATEVTVGADIPRLLPRAPAVQVRRNWCVRPLPERLDMMARTRRERAEASDGFDADLTARMVVRGSWIGVHGPVLHHGVQPGCSLGQVRRRSRIQPRHRAFCMRHEEPRPG